MGFIRQYGEFVVLTFLQRTPMIVVLGSMALVCGFAIRGGVEVLARLCEMLVPIVILLWVFVVILLIPEMETKNLLPILEKGWMPSIKGAISPMGWFSHVMLIAFLLPFISDVEKGMKWGMISVFCIFFTLFSINVATLLVFGGITSGLTFPVMNASRYISVADFLEHLEAIIMAIWIVSAFMKISLYLFATSVGSSQWLHLSDYRPAVFPLAFILLLLGSWVSPNLAELSHYVGTITPFYNLTIELVIPICLLLIAFIRQRFVKV